MDAYLLGWGQEQLSMSSNNLPGGTFAVGEPSLDPRPASSSWRPPVTLHPGGVAALTLCCQGEDSGR